MSAAQNWTLPGMVTVLLGVVGGLLVHQVRLVADRLEARMGGFESTMNARFDAVDQRFAAMDRRFDHLDRDVEAIVRIVFSGVVSRVPAA